MKGGGIMDLNINFEELNNVGNQVIAKGGEFQDLLNRIKAANNELQSYWQGDDASKYSNAVAQQAESIQKLVNTVNQIGETLLSVSRAYQEVVNDNSGAING